MESTRPDYSRGNKMDPQWKEAIRKAQKWIDRVKSNLHIVGVINGEELTKNREAWRDVVNAAKGLNGLH